MRVGESLSELEDVKSGVAQGTLLGPLLFAVFISDVSSILERSTSSLILYADDTKVYGSSRNTQECNKLQEDILKLEAWCNSWQLSINEDKSEVLRLGTHNPHFPYTLNGSVIPTKSSCRDLGVQIGENAYYRKHYETKTRTCHFLCKQFRSSFATNDKEFLVFLFRTYIIPKIEYASNVWSPYYKKDINTLENIQRKFTSKMQQFQEFDETLGMPVCNMSYPDRLKKLKLHTPVTYYFFLFAFNSRISSSSFKFCLKFPLPLYFRKAYSPL